MPYQQHPHTMSLPARYCAYSSHPKNWCLWLADRLAVAHGPAVIMSETYGAVNDTNGSTDHGWRHCPCTGLHQPLWQLEGKR